MKILGARPWLAGVLLLTQPSLADAASAHRKSFGSLPDGSQVEAVTLTNKRGVSATVITYGATLQSLIAPDRHGKKADIVLSYKDAAAFADHGNFFGATVGRYANRIADGRFTLDGKTYQLAKNHQGTSALHGGERGFDKVNWKLEELKSGRVASATMTMVSPDGDQGYPGTLHVSAIFSLDENNDLRIEYRARTNKPTIVNLTSHGYFNMAGEGSPDGALGNRLTIWADRYTPVDQRLIPTGELLPVAGTPFDFRTPRLISGGVRDGSHPQIALGRGYDHNYVLRGAAGRAPRLVARLEDPISGRRMDLLSDQSGLQLYSGNFIDGSTAGKTDRIYRMGDGIALEPQHFPDSPNRPEFPSARLDPGGLYRNVMVLRLGVSP